MPLGGLNRGFKLAHFLHFLHSLSATTRLPLDLIPEELPESNSSQSNHSVTDNQTDMMTV